MTKTAGRVYLQTSRAFGNQRLGRQRFWKLIPCIFLFSFLTCRPDPMLSGPNKRIHEQMYSRNILEYVGINRNICLINMRNLRNWYLANHATRTTRARCRINMRNFRNWHLRNAQLAQNTQSR